ncbi:hypothetical protein [Sphingobacterium sp. BIGb0116]|jgi:hypothetical protein|uniref:hypothetical protein n=1 Tax=Sphingobacterium sp. BIGb0116 TaxID=2940619 RepID=UPI00216A1FC9|nr:hypothetical protein [Sphingobacterium sp. BIGb0116]MCS4168499.1 hypothetical protein [Sphingobacterium sp. BIGb0116]
MGNQEEIEKKIIEIVHAQHPIDGGNNGVDFGAFEHVLKLDRKERNEFLFQMAKENKDFPEPERF